jgi:hypothetical protein
MNECSICNREVDVIEKHHLTPKVKKGTETIPVCPPCGDQLHQLFSIQELKYLYNTLDKILANEKVQKWIKFISKRKDNSVCMKRKKKK